MWLLRGVVRRYINLLILLIQVYRQSKVWKRVADDIFESLELDKGEWVESISKGETSIKEFLALVDKSIKESNRYQFLKGLNIKTK